MLGVWRLYALPGKVDGVEGTLIFMLE